MPMDRLATFHLALLLLVVPVQYLISQYMSSPEDQRSHALKHIVKTAVSIRDKYMSWNYWQNLCVDLLSHVKKLPYSEASDALEEDLGESPAYEVLKYEEPEGYFATSPEPRSPRPPGVLYRVGQVIKHKRWNYRGIIVGWDERAKAPESWMKEMHGDNKHWTHQPNYAVLVDTRDRVHPQKTYVPQENLQTVSNTRVIHPAMDRFFEKFDGTQYLARPWLRTIYPHD